MRQPHVRSGRYLPPANPPRTWRPWAEAVVGALAIIVLAWLAFVVLPVMGAPVP